MRLSKDKTQLCYKNLLTLDSPFVSVVRLLAGQAGRRFEWVVRPVPRQDRQHRSGTVNDPNRRDDPEGGYIVRQLESDSR